MFRTIEKSVMCSNQFGVGSTIWHEGLGRRAQWMVIGYGPTSGVVGLLNLDTMICVLGSISVADENYLSENEARELVDILGKQHQCTFSDYTLVPEGLKVLYIKG